MAYGKTFGTDPRVFDGLGAEWEGLHQPAAALSQRGIEKAIRAYNYYSDYCLHQA